MAKQCPKCSKKYDDSLGTCLFCGSKLECKGKRGEKGDEELTVSKLEFLTMTIIIAIIIIGIFYLIYVAGAGYWSDFQDNMYNRGRFPNIKLEKP